MRLKFWEAIAPSLNGLQAEPDTLDSLRAQVADLTEQRDQALSDSRNRSLYLTMIRVGRVNVDPAQWTAHLRRIVPDILVVMIGYELVFLSRNPVSEAEFNGIQAISPFTIDRT